MNVIEKDGQFYDVEAQYWLRMPAPSTRTETINGVEVERPVIYTIEDAKKLFQKRYEMKELLKS